jgi:type IV secretory pathway TrbL component
MSTAFLTGLLILFMWQYQLSSLLVEQIIIVLGWFVMIVLTLPNRKSLAIAVDYWMETKFSENDVDAK